MTRFNIMEIPLSIPFIFWNKNNQEPEHKISAISKKPNIIVTGSMTGEIVFWLEQDEIFVPTFISSINKQAICLSLCFVNGPMPELVGSSLLAASLHNDNKIRLWDIKDGRCTSVSSSSLLPNYQFFQLTCFKEQFLAVSGDCSDIFIVDSWSMEKLTFFSMSGRVVKVVATSSALWAVDTNESLRKFEIGINSPYYFSSEDTQSIGNTASFSYNVRESIEDMVISEEFNIIVVKVKGGLRIFLIHWIEEDRKEYYHLDDEKILSVFCTHDVVIVKKNKIKFVDLHSLQKIGTGLKEKFLSRSNSLTNIRVHSFKHMMKEQKFSCESIFLFEFGSELIYGFKDNILYQYDRKDFSLRKFPFSFKQISYECFADMNLHYNLADGELITCSLVFLTADWPIYIIGTSLGKIYMSHFQPFQSIHQFVYHSSPITCIYIKGEKMVSCCKSHSMCIWDLKLEKLEINPEDQNISYRSSKRKSLQILHHRSSSSELLCNKPAHTIEFFFGSIRKILRVEAIQEDKPLESTDLLIGQSKDFAVILVSLSPAELLGFYPPISGYAKEAYLLCNMNYLYIISEDDQLFVFNIDCNVQERVISGIDVNAITRRPARTRIRTETFEEIVEETTPRQKVVMFNLRQFFPNYAQNALKISTGFIGNVSVSILTINIQQILKKLKKLNGPSRQLEYILSLLTCWIPGCKSHDSIIENIKDLLSLNYPAIKANIGLVGVDNTLSFTLPSNRSYFEVSPYVSALVMSAAYSLVEGLYQFLSSSVKKNSRVITGHLISPAHDSNSFQIPFLTVLAIQSFYGIFPARFILQDNIVFIDLKSKHRFLECLFSILDEQKSAMKRSEKYVGLMEALCCTLLGYSMIELKILKKEIIHQILTNLRKMLKSENEGYYITAAGILGRGMEMWRQELSSVQIKEIVEELVLYGCKETQQHKQVFFRALINIASCSFIDFIEILAQEIENMDIDPLYPSSCIEVLDLFIEQKYEEVAAYLPAVIELIVRTLNPHNPMLRKTTIEKASHTLKTLILKLPMISFTQKQQRLAIGTMDNLVVVYDLKTASQWKLLKYHSGPVCAVQFDKSGDFLASYSSVDCSVLVWKLKTGFIQDLIGSSSTKPVKVHQVSCCDWHQSNYKKFLDTIRLTWSPDNKIFLVREDGNKQMIQS